MFFMFKTAFRMFAASSATLLGNLLFLAIGFFLCLNRKKAHLPGLLFWVVAALFVICEVVVDLTVVAILPEGGGFYLIANRIGVCALMFSCGALLGFLVTLFQKLLRPSASE